MKKRLKKKLNKLNKIRICDECGSIMNIKYIYSYNDYCVGNIVLNNKYYECPKCKFRWITYEMMTKRDNIRKTRIQELLLKKFPINDNNYINEEKMSIFENCSVNELLNNNSFNFVVYHIDVNNKRYYLKKSYDIYKKTNKKGWFNLNE